MAYTLRWHPRTQIVSRTNMKRHETSLHPLGWGDAEFLHKCDPIVSSRIVKKVDSIKDGPLLHIQYYSNLKAYKFRVGDWRVLMDVDRKNKVIEILIVDHRSRVYKNL